MRRVVVVLMLVAFVPWAVADELPPSIEGTDASGDVELFAPDGSSLGTTDQFPHLDILGGRVLKAESGDMAFGIHLTDPSFAQRGDQTGDPDTSIALHFEFGEIQYYVDYGDWRREAGEACLTRYIDGDRIDPIQCLPTTMDDDWIEVEFPGRLITDHLGAMLRHPAQLDAIRAESLMDLVGVTEVGTARAVDRAPDDGIWGEILTPADAGAGPLVVTPVQAVRGSNGGPSVIAFHLLVESIVDEPVRATVRTADLPDGWDAIAPAQVQVSPGATHDVPVLLRIPTLHVHGLSQTFNVTVSTDERSWTRELGIHFFTVPQPAGHHDTVYLHGVTTPDFTDSWLDTIQDNERDDGTPEDGWWTARDVAQDRATTLYHVRLSPDLRIGLDFRTDEAVAADLTFTSAFETTADVRVALDHCNPFDNSGRSFAEYGGDMRCPGSWFPLAETTETVTITPQGTALPEALFVTDYADVVPPAEGALLALDVELTRSVADEYSNSVLLQTTGSSLTLPLDEYRDPLDDDLAVLDDLRIEGEGALTVGPGSQVWLPWTVHNDGHARTLSVEVFGHNAAWAEVRPTTLDVAAGGHAPLSIGVSVPDHGGLADLFIVATDVDDRAVTVAHDLRVVADPAAEVRSDAAPAGGGKASPGPAFVSLGLMLAALAARRR